MLDVAALLAGEVNGLLLQGDLGRKGLEVALGKQLSLKGRLALRCETTLLPRLG